MSWANLAFLLVFVCSYVVFGGSVFYMLESSNSKEHVLVMQARQFLSKYKNVEAKDLQVLLKDVVPQDLLTKVTADKKEVSRQELTQWNFMNSVFFATSVITTIGYGDLCPSTSTGRLFVVLFGITGIPLLMLSISELTKKILGALEHISSHPPKFFSHLPLVFRHSRNINSIKIFVILLGGSILCIAIPSLTFSLLESWTFGESMYYAFATLSTIGFGDFIAGVERGNPYPLWYLFFRQVWLFVGLVWLSSLYTIIQQECSSLLNRKTVSWKTNNNNKEILQNHL